MAGKLTVNRHPVLIDNETQVVCDLQPGESLYSFLHRHIENLDGQQIAVTVNNELVDCADWHSLRPKDGANIYVRFVVQRSALMIVALVALSVFTAGAAAAIAGGAVSGMGGAFGAFLVGNMGALAANAVVGAIQIVGAMLINKVLGPKPVSAGGMDRDSVFNFSGTRNSSRQYEPLGLLLGSVRVTPDILSIPYTWYRDNDQYLGMVLTPGVNVDSFDPLSIGETPLSTYEGVVVTASGFSGMPEQEIPLYTNVDTLDGGALDAEHNVPGAWIERTGPADTIRLQVNLSYLLFDLTSKGKEKLNQETVIAQYRQVGEENWLHMGSYFLQSKVQTEQRRSFTKDVERGQYEVRVRRLGLHTDGSGATCNMNLSGIGFIQADDASYKGIARIGVEMRATGQLNGAPSQVRGMMHARTMPYWNGTDWVNATRGNGLSNPGAQILQYARGFRDEDGVLLAGMGLPDDLIDIESLQAFMVHCAENDFQYNHWITDARSHDDIINGIARAGMGRYSWAPGKLTMIWVAEGQPHEGVATMANIKSGEFQVDYSLSQAADGIEYTYVDRETWESKTLRVPAPGITVMENPARLSGEGVGTEAHAALLARYHLGQNLYQFKDIVFGQDLEHMAYGELSVIMLSHDMTQWGFSGRLVAASRTADGITVEIDQGVPLDATRTPYVGLRIPGEGNYRVFQVQRITDTMLRLVGNWPVGVPFPGDSEKNPAHDTIWLYDFKQTPGLRCRVVGLSPADNLNGASISVVPESDEFWNYVKTGEYLPPQQDSLLALRPSVRNLRLQENFISQGNTVYSEIHADWLTEGVAARFTVSVAGEDGVYRQLADTTGLSHEWRMKNTGFITVLVRPFDGDGVPGVAQSATLQVYGADKPPVIVDSFDVLELSGGVRNYSWGFNADTIQSPDMAGVEIRIMEGTNGVAAWDDMAPLGESGFYTAPFEATVPPAGDWTFALRTVNTNGVLSANHFVITRTLTANLGEVLGEIGGKVEQSLQELVDQQVALDDEIFNRVQGDLNEATARGAAIAAEATARSQALTAEATARTNAIAAEAAARGAAILDAKVELTADIATETLLRQSADQSLASQIATISAGTGEQFDTGGGIWYFDTAVDGWSGSVAPTANNGWLRTGVDSITFPYVQSPVTSFDSTMYRYIKSRIRKSAGIGVWRGIVQWITATDQSWNSIKQMTFAEPVWSADNIATMDMSEIPWESGVTQIRLFLFRGPLTPTVYWEHDWVSIGRPSPGASAAALQTEREARISGDAAQATARETLAAQMRGNYTGTDAAGVTSGLVFSERQARVSADAAIASDVSSLQARMPTGSGKVATEASVTAEATARASADSALASRTSVIEGRMPAGAGALATEARVVSAENAAASANAATANRVGVVEARMPAGNGALATQASVTAVEDASITRDNANASAIQNVQSAMGSAVLGYNLSFEEGNGTGKLNWYTNTSLTAEGMMVDSGFYSTSVAHGSWAVRLNPTTASRAWYNGMQFPVVPGERIYVQMDSRTAGSTPAIGTDLRIGLRVWLVDGTATNTYAPRYIATVSEGWLWGQKILSGWLTMPANAVKACLLIYNAGQTEGSIIIDDIRIERESLSDAANASGISGLTTRVSSAEGQIAAQATSINQVTAAADSASASITQLSEVVAQSNAVVVVDGSFEGNRGWSNGSNSLDTPSYNLSSGVVYQSSLIHVRSGNRSLRFGNSTTALSAFNNSWIRVQAGQKLRITFWAKRYSTMAATDYVRISGRLYKQDGTIPYTYMGGAIAGTTLTTSFQKSTFVYTVPADVWCIQLAVQCLNASNTAAYAYVDDVSVELIGEELESARAKHTVALDVNGNVSGTVNENDGTRSSFSILATVFRVLSSVTGTGMEWQDGYLRMWKGSAQLVMGHTFGSGNLIFWYGPNIGSAACTKGNGTIWFDTAGGAYFGGSLSAGVLKNASQTTVLTANPSIDVGPFTTLGRTKAVTVGYSASGPTIRAYFPGRPSNSPPPPQTVPAPAATTLYLYRSYGGGAEQLVTSAPIGHGPIEVFADYLDRDAFDPNLPNGGWYQDYYFISTGSMTVSDTTSGTNTFKYRAYAVSGGYPRDRQTLSVISVEQ